MTKNELRKLYLEKRMALSEADCFQYNRKLYDHFFTAVDLSFLRVLHTFLPIPGKNEPDTWLLIDRIRREFPHLTISLPKVNNVTGQLDNVDFEGLFQLRQNSWGISEPIKGASTPTEKIDMILVPLLVADQQGHRLGYGKGYYDKLLAQCRPDCRKIGLSFFPPIERIAAAESHDRKLDGLITPGGYQAF